MSADKPFTREYLDTRCRKVQEPLLKLFTKKEDLHEFYKECRKLEQENREALVVFRENYPRVLNGDNLADILKAAKEKQQ